MYSLKHQLNHTNSNLFNWNNSHQSLLITFLFSG
jgi:hypothetical protein